MLSDRGPRHNEHILVAVLIFASFMFSLLFILKAIPYINIDEIFFTHRNYQYPRLGYLVSHVVTDIFNLFFVNTPSNSNDIIFNQHNMITVPLTRLTVFLINSLSIPFLYIATNKLISKNIALITICIFSFSLFCPSTLNYAYFDSLILGVSNIFIWATVCLYKAQNKGQELKFYALIFALLGILFSIRFQSIILLVPIILIYIRNKTYSHGKNKDLIIFSLALLAPLIFLAINSDWVFDSDGFLHALVYSNQRYKGHHWGMVPNNVFLFNLKSLFAYPYGLGGIILFGGGTIYLIQQKRFFDLAILYTPPLLMMLLLCQYNITFSRNIALALPYVYIIMASGVGFIQNRSRQIRLVGFLFLSVFIFYSAQNIYVTYRYYNLPDSRFAVSKWVGENIPRSSTIFVDNMSYEHFRLPIIDTNKFNLKRRNFFGIHYTGHFKETEDEIRSSIDFSPGDYYIESFEWTQFYLRKKEYFFYYSNEHIYPESLSFCKKNREDKLMGKMVLIKEFPSKFYYDGEPTPLIWGLASLNFFSNFNGYYSGPTIKIFKKAPNDKNAYAGCIY